ncbi:helicase SRCAP-like [Narcine bancroftii]|uniref:helicase SRCAP-like n=1 Tax=Narcine bancroftii TaxID=1343680 RepID=UPI0038313425
MDPLLRQLKAGGHRVLLFTQMTRMLDILEQFLNFHGHIYLRLDGSTKVEQRQILMDRFNADSRIFCFILSTRSGGVGVNLTGADTVLFYDSDWNPTMDAQAQDRCHRIGQTRDVHIYRLISDRTVEENILKKANQKRMLGDLAIEGGNFTTAFFKEQTIRELFDLPTDTHRETLPTSIPLPTVPPPPRPEEEDSMSAKQTQILEQALCRAEDEEDIRAASLAKAEQVEELAEFNESIPLEGEEGASREEGAELSKAELEIAALVEQLTPIERYAMNYLEASLESISKEELKQAEEQVEAARKDLHQARDESWRWAEPEEDAGEEVSSRRLRRSRLTPQSRSGTRLSQRLRVSRTPEGMDEGGGSLLSYPAQAHDLQIHISPELPEQIFAEEPGVCGGEFPSQGLPIPGSGGQKAEGLGSGGQRADGPGGQRTEGQVSGGHMAECPDMGPVLSLGPGGQRAEGPVSGGASPSLVLGPQGQRAEGPLLVFPGAMGTEGLVEANAMSNGALALEVTTEGQRSEEVLHQMPVAVEGRRSGEVILEMPVTMGVVSRRSVEVVAETPITVDARDERSSELITETTVMDAGSQRSAEVITKSPVNMDAGSQRSSEVVNKAPVTVNAGSQRTAEVVTKTQVTVDIGQRSVEVVAKTPFPKDTGSWRSAEVVAESLVTMDVGGQRSAEVVAETPVIVDAGSWRSAEVVAKVPVTVDAGSRGSAEFVAKTLVTTDAGAQKSEEDISKPLVTTDVGSQGSREGTLETADIVNQKSEIALRTLVATDTESQRSGEGNPRTLVATDTGQRSGAGDLQTSVITDMEVQRLGGEAPVAVRTEGQAGMGRGKRRRRTADRSLLPEQGQAEDGAQVSGTVLRKVPGRVNVVVQRREPSAKRRRPGVGRGAVSLPSSDPVPSPPLAKRPHPEEQEEVPAEPPTPRSTRQRPGNLLPPLERRRYKPRGWCVAPKPPPPPPHPKKRGRPPSSASPPGRPPKIRTVTDPPMTPARRGRPPKHPPTDTPPRRGRPPGKGPHGRTLPPPPRPRGRPPSVAARGRGVRRPKS